MTSVYIAGPMRGIKDFNFDAFYDAEVEIHNHFCPMSVEYPPNGSVKPGIVQCSEASLTVFNPARRDRDKYGPDVNKSETGDLADLPAFDLREALGADLNWIAQEATHIYMLDGWERSKGAKAEKALAEALGLTVLYQGELELWEDTTGADLIIEMSAREEQMLSASDIRAMIDPYSEVRVTSATGGQKGQKLSQIGALDPLALKVVGEVAGFGAQKYARYNYLKGYDWSLSYDAGQRHLMEFWGGTDLDPESGLPHLAHAAWQALALLSFYLRSVGTDDRPPTMG